MTDAATPTIASLFHPRFNGQWGTRGDTYLWTEMREHFASTTIPETDRDLRHEIEAVFKLLTERDMGDSDEMFYIKRLDPGSGISAGVVSPQWWRMTALPVLIERARERGLVTNFMRDLP